MASSRGDVLPTSDPLAGGPGRGGRNALDGLHSRRFARAPARQSGMPPAAILVAPRASAVARPLNGRAGHDAAIPSSQSQPGGCATDGCRYPGERLRFAPVPRSGHAYIDPAAQQLQQRLGSLALGGGGLERLHVRIAHPAHAERIGYGVCQVHSGTARGRPGRHPETVPQGRAIPGALPHRAGIAGRHDPDRAGHGKARCSMTAAAPCGANPPAPLRRRRRIRLRLRSRRASPAQRR